VRRLGAMLLWTIAAAAAAGQQDIWSGVKPWMDLSRITPATLSDSQQAAIRRLLWTNRRSIGWECGGNELTQMLKGLTFENIPLSETRRVLLVEAGAGCARGGQGSNGAMWLVRLDGNSPALMASPRNGFNGWLFAIPENESHGYRDVVLGWHMGATEGGLNYLRFNGKSYQGVGSASYTMDDDDNVKIIPNR